MKRRAQQETQFAVCVNNRGYEASLEAGKLYRVIPDVQAALHGYIRVIDESGEDYGYSVRRFFPIEVPRALARVLTSTPGPLTEDIVQVRGARGSRTKFERALSKERSTKPHKTDRL